MLFTFSLHRKAVTREVSENILPFVVAHGFPASGWFPSTRGRGAAVAGDFRRFWAGGIRGNLDFEKLRFGGACKANIAIGSYFTRRKKVQLHIIAIWVYICYMSKVLRSSPLEAKKPKNYQPAVQRRLVFWRFWSTSGFRKSTPLEPIRIRVAEEGWAMPSRAAWRRRSRQRWWRAALETGPETVK